MYRKAREIDCRRIYELICELECESFSYRKFSEIYHRQIVNPCYCYIVCERDNDVVGFLNLRFEEQLHHLGWIAEILEFVVEAEYRNSGIGSEMFEKACQIAKNYNCEQIEVACNQQRSETHRFYLNKGMNNSHFKFSKSLLENDIETSDDCSR